MTTTTTTTLRPTDATCAALNMTEIEIARYVLHEAKAASTKAEARHERRPTEATGAAAYAAALLTAEADAEYGEALARAS